MSIFVHGLLAGFVLSVVTVCLVAIVDRPNSSPGKERDELQVKLADCTAAVEALRRLIAYEDAANRDIASELGAEPTEEMRKTAWDEARLALGRVASQEPSR